MNEGRPKTERVPTISKEDVVASLQKDPNEFSVLQLYLDSREKQVTTSKEALALTIEVAEIYKVAGLTQAALAAFSDAADQAWEEKEDELYARLQDEIQNVKTMLN